MRPGHTWASAVVCLAALAIEPAFAQAQDQRPTAAILPTQGPLSRESLKAVTIEFRARVREQGYRLARQQDVREAAARAGVDGPPTVSQLAQIGQEVGAAIVFSPLVAGRPGEQLRIELLALRAPDTALGPLSEELDSIDGRAIDIDAVETAVASLVEQLLEPFPAQPVSREVDLEGDAHDQPQQMKDYRGKLTDEYDHEGFFIDLGFMLAFCQGKTMCHDVNPGYGGRLRLGYRIKAHFGVSLTGIVAGHNVPFTYEEVVRTDRAFVWTGVYGGMRYYPLNRHWFDPFIGLDMGWTWILYTELVTGTGEGEMTYMGLELDELTEQRNNLSLNGFTFNPQIGVRFFVTRNVSLGVVLNFVLPIWREACNKFTAWELGEKISSGDKCVDIENADSEFLQTEYGELKDRGELPWFLDLDIDLAFTF
jgi:hypothetical protein